MHVRRSKCVGTTVFAFILKKAEREFRYRRSLRNSRIFANFPWTAFVWSWSLQCLAEIHGNCAVLSRVAIHGRPREREVGQKTVQWKGRGAGQGGSPGMRCMQQHKRRVNGERMWGTYAPLWRKALDGGDTEKQRLVPNFGVVQLVVWIQVLS